MAAEISVRQWNAQMITKECFGCGKITAHRHVHDCAHGIPAETHMAGTERFVCELCGHVTQAGSGGAERFSFTFDKVRSRRESR
jgi:DNA-binding transcriptional regulator LsrR (DeoR family)